jgi:hypothetical protein
MLKHVAVVLLGGSLIGIAQTSRIAAAARGWFVVTLGFFVLGLLTGSSRSAQ